MSEPRRAKRRDLHHAEIREGLREVGYHTIDTASLGDGFPDLLVVSRQGQAVLLEVKTAGEGLTDDEKEFHADYKAPLRIVHSLAEALEVMWNEENPY